MKVLFLDIDGVLNHDTTKEIIKVKGYYGLCGLDKILIGRFLNWWDNRDHISLVLSSMWRYHPEMVKVLHDNELVFVGQTAESSANVWRVSSRSRGDEIQDWLDLHPEVTHYAILDDNDWFKAEQRKHFVQTDPKVGLQPEDLAILDKILELNT